MEVFTDQLVEINGTVVKNRGLGILQRIHRIPALWCLPIKQDDVSSNCYKLPQISPGIYFIMFSDFCPQQVTTLVAGNFGAGAAVWWAGYLGAVHEADMAMGGVAG